MCSTKCGRHGSSLTRNGAASPPGLPPWPGTRPSTGKEPSAAGRRGERSGTRGFPTLGTARRSQVLKAEERERLQEAIRNLSHQEQILFYRKYYYLQSTRQIAAELGTSERAVEGKLYRLRKKLQKALGGEFDA